MNCRQDQLIHACVRVYIYVRTSYKPFYFPLLAKRPLEDTDIPSRSLLYHFPDSRACPFSNLSSWPLPVPLHRMAANQIRKLPNQIIDDLHCSSLMRSYTGMGPPHSSSPSTCPPLLIIPAAIQCAALEKSHLSDRLGRFTWRVDPEEECRSRPTECASASGASSG